MVTLLVSKEFYSEMKMAFCFSDNVVVSKTFEGYKNADGASTILVFKSNINELMIPDRTDKYLLGMSEERENLIPIEYHIPCITSNIILDIEKTIKNLESMQKSLKQIDSISYQMRSNDDVDLIIDADRFVFNEIVLKNGFNISPYTVGAILKEIVNSNGTLSGLAALLVSKYDVKRTVLSKNELIFKVGDELIKLKLKDKPVCIVTDRINERKRDKVKEVFTRDLLNKHKIKYVDINEAEVVLKTKTSEFTFLLCNGEFEGLIEELANKLDEVGLEMLPTSIVDKGNFKVTVAKRR